LKRSALLRLCPWWELRWRGAHGLISLWPWENLVPIALEQPADEHRVCVDACGVIELVIPINVGEHIAPKACAQDGRVDGLIVRVHHFDVPSGFELEDPATSLARPLLTGRLIAVGNFPGELVAEINLLPDTRKDVLICGVAQFGLVVVSTEYAGKLRIILGHGHGEIEFRLGLNLTVHPDGG
jgi:hypothetical protein